VKSVNIVKYVSLFILIIFKKYIYKIYFINVINVIFKFLFKIMSINYSLFGNTKYYFGSIIFNNIYFLLFNKYLFFFLFEKVEKSSFLSNKFTVLLNLIL